MAGFCLNYLLLLMLICLDLPRKQDHLKSWIMLSHTRQIRDLDSEALKEHSHISDDPGDPKTDLYKKKRLLKEEAGAIST